MITRLPSSVALALILVVSCTPAPRAEPVVERIEDPDPSGPPYLRNYKESHYRALGTKLEPARSLGAMIDAAEGARVVYLGDHHNDRHLHANLMRTLNAMSARGRQLAFGVESIGIADEPDLREFLGGTVSLAALRLRVRDRWAESWLDRDDIDVEFYRDVLRLAARDGHDVFALEPTPRLELGQRDASMVQRVREYAEANPSKLVVVIVGHAHLLGEGAVAQRVDLPHVVVAARMSMSLLLAYRELGPPPGGVLRSNAGVWFFNPPPETVDVSVDSVSRPR